MMMLVTVPFAPSELLSLMMLVQEVAQSARQMSIKASWDNHRANSAIRKPKRMAIWPSITTRKTIVCARLDMSAPTERKLEIQVAKFAAKTLTMMILGRICALRAQATKSPP